jgi:hypothetical protein
MKKRIRIILAISASSSWMLPFAHGSEISHWIQDRTSILAQSGCYRVSYQFKEKSVTDPDYPIHSPDYMEYGTEWIDAEVSKSKPNEIKLQHILITPDGPLKHWSQTWNYEPTSVMIYSGDHLWKKEHLKSENTRGQWSQHVFQVDGSPRYGCVAAWTHTPEKDFWECKTWSPLPRREFSKRKDYNVLERLNHHEITPIGWIHLQNNSKLQVSSSTVHEIALEEGADTYTRIHPDHCQAAIDWWKKNQPIWSDIHHVWNEIYLKSESLQLKSTVNQKTLWERLFEIAETQTNIQNQTQQAIQEFLVHSPQRSNLP